MLYMDCAHPKALQRLRLGGAGRVLSRPAGTPAPNPLKRDGNRSPPLTPVTGG